MVEQETYFPSAWWIPAISQKKKHGDHHGHNRPFCRTCNPASQARLWQWTLLSLWAYLMATDVCPSGSDPAPCLLPQLQRTVQQEPSLLEEMPGPKPGHGAQEVKRGLLSSKTETKSELPHLSANGECGLCRKAFMLLFCSPLKEKIITHRVFLYI